MPVGRKSKVVYRLVVFSFNQTVVGASVLLTEDETNADGMLEYTGSLDDDAGLGFYPVSSTGTYGTISVDASGNWTYLADNSQSSIQNLRSGEFVSDVFAIFSKDDATIVKVQITIKGVNEAVTVTVSDATGEMTEDVLTGGVLSAAGTVVTSDSGDMRAETLSGDFGTLTIQADGSWVYSADNDQSSVQEMAPGDSLTDQFVVTHSNGLTTGTVTLTIHGADDAPDLTGSETSVSEDTEPLTTSGLVSTTGGDDGENLFIADTFTGLYGELVLDEIGQWTYSADGSQSVIQQLSEQESLTETFVVYSSDGVTTASIVITITGADDVPVLSEGTGSVTEDAANASDNLVVSGTLTASGGDAGEQSFLSDALSGSYGTLVLASNGDWTYIASNSQSAIQELSENDSLNELFVVYSSDGVTTTTITITINGTDDVPVLTGSSGSVTEDNAATLTVSGSLSTSGGDAGEDTFLGGMFLGNYGYIMLSNNGTWTYYADNTQSVIQALNTGETLTDTFNVFSSDRVTKAKITITIHGLDDNSEDLTPVLTGDSATLTEDDSATLTASGVVTSTGGDPGEEGFIAETISGTYGSFSIDSDGNWTYSADNAQPVIQQLRANGSLVENFTVTSADNVTTTTVQIIIQGTDDVPVLTSGSAEITEDDAATLTASGQVLATGGDFGDDGFIAETQAGLYGSLTIDSEGNWVYSADNAQNAIQELTQLDSLTDVFVVTSSDGVTETTVTITINGSDDTPVLTSAVSTVSMDNAVGDVLHASGTLSSSGGDLGEDGFVAETLSGDIGSLTVDTSGNWIWTGDATHASLQTLVDQNDTYSEVYTVTGSDTLTTTTVTITVKGQTIMAEINDGTWLAASVWG